MSHGVHNDEKRYTDAGKFDPFRFADQRLESQLHSRQDDPEIDVSLPTTKGDNNSEYIKKANLAFVSTSPSYHPFGHGRHACPGRFFASNELKIFLAYVVMNYEFEFLDTRPESKWMGTVLLPPMDRTIRVRRRKV
jgi:cytochrome P450